jgi:hypothetical protein
MTPTRVILTYKDYAALPADGKRHQLHEGPFCEDEKGDSPP